MGSTEHRVAGLCEVTIASSNVRPNFSFRGLSTFHGSRQNRSRSSRGHRHVPARRVQHYSEVPFGVTIFYIHTHRDPGGRVWLDEYITVELQTVPCSGSCHHGIDLHGDLQSHKKRNQQRFTTCAVRRLCHHRAETLSSPSGLSLFQVLQALQVLVVDEMRPSLPSWGAFRVL